MTTNEASTTTTETKKARRTTVEVTIKRIDRAWTSMCAVLDTVRKWDFSNEHCGLGGDVRGTSEDHRKSFGRLLASMENLRAAGFVARATEESRFMAKLWPGSRVKLKDPTPWLEVYTAEEVENITVEKVAKFTQAVFIRSGDRHMGMANIDLLE